jgi:Arc/MetJ-type ribon-helix-helix transcriptional regulator
MSQKFPHHVGIRLTPAEHEGLQKLVVAAGYNQSEVIRFLVRTAAQRPDMVASGLRREKVKPREPQS